MKITKVELLHYDEIKPGTLVDGLPIPSQPEIYAFEVESDEGSIVVPNDPSNRHYREVAEWYDKKKNKPFDFDFEAADEPGKTLPVYDQDNPRAATPTVSGNQVEPADLPDVNLTDDQRKELAGS